MPEAKKFAELSLYQRTVIVTICALLSAAVAVVTIVLAGVSIRLIEWAWS